MPQNTASWRAVVGARDVSGSSAPARVGAECRGMDRCPSHNGTVGARCLERRGNSAANAIGDASFEELLLGRRRTLEASVRAADPSVLVVFSHVHKAMGCAMCRLAASNYGDNATNSGSTCCLLPFETVVSIATKPRYRNWTDMDTAPLRWAPLCLLRSLTPTGVRGLPQLAQDASIRFVASEGRMPTILPVDARIVWVSAVRDPLQRLISAWGWWERMPVFNAADIACSLDADSRAERGRPNVSQWFASHPRHFMAETFCGRRLDVKELLPCAMRRMERFSVIAVAEQPMEDYNAR